MPLDEFTEDSWSKLVKGDDQIPVGFSGQAFDAFEKKRQEMFQGMTKMVKERGH